MNSAKIKDVAETAWLIASDEAEASQSVPFKAPGSKRPGVRYQSRGGVARLIRMACRELKISCKKNDISTIRTYLRRRHNVVSSGSVAGKTDRYWIFVASSYSNKVVEEFSENAQKKATGKVLVFGTSAPKEAEVKTRNFWDEISSTPLGEAQAETLKSLAEHGGKFTGNFTLSDMGLDPSSVGSLEERGLLVSRKTHKRKYERIELTALGRYAAANLPYTQRTAVGLSHFLQSHGSYEAPPRKFTQEVGDLIHSSTGATANAINDLDDLGLIKVTRSPSGQYFQGIQWIDGSTPLGVGFPNNKHTTTTEEETEEFEEMATTTDDFEIVEEGVEEETAVVTVSQEPSSRDDLMAEIYNRLREAYGDSPNDMADRILNVCSKVEQGKMSSLKAIVEIQEIAQES